MCNADLFGVNRFSFVGILWLPFSRCRERFPGREGGPGMGKRAGFAGRGHGEEGLVSLQTPCHTRRGLSGATSSNLCWKERQSATTMLPLKQHLLCISRGKTLFSPTTYLL